MPFFIISCDSLNVYKTQRKSKGKFKSNLLCAKVPSLRPDLEYIPMAAVASTQRFGDKVNALEPARDLPPPKFEGFKIQIMQRLPKP